MTGAGSPPPGPANPHLLPEQPGRTLLLRPGCLEPPACGRRALPANEPLKGAGRLEQNAADAPRLGYDELDDRDVQLRGSRIRRGHPFEPTSAAAGPGRSGSS
jgi:hypothetical protein